MSYDNRNSGIITRNDKQGNEKRPDYRGSINVDGRDYWISAWIKTGRDGTKLAGQKYMSLSVEPKDAQAGYSSSQSAASASSSASRPYDTSGSAKPYGAASTSAQHESLPIDIQYALSPQHSAALRREERALAAAQAARGTGTSFDDMDDDIPF